MDNGKLAFRTTAVGGFHKQDVISYIQSLAKNYAEQLNRLKVELDDEKAARAAAEGKCVAGEQIVTSDTDEVARLREVLDAQVLASVRLEEALRVKTERLEQAEGECETWKAELEATTRGIEPLQARLDEAEREIAALRAQLSEREREAEQNAAALAAMESDAQGRARQAAEAAAAALTAECDNHLAQIQARYAQLRGNIEATVLRATGELERAQTVLTSAMAAFHEQDEQA